MWLLKTKKGPEYQTEDCPVIDKQVVASGYCRVALHAPVIARKVDPGQFVQIFMPPEHRDHMLPRPFSIFGANRKNGELVILLEIKGRGTDLLAGTGPGSSWKLLGPLGTGFPALSPASLLVAGGMGIAPLAFLAASAAVPCTLIYGARTAGQLICPQSDLNRPGLSLLETTEDGSRGEKGTAVDLLSRLIADAGTVFACGPRPMLAAVNNLCRRAGIEAWVSVEERMACGVGACLGCAVATGSGYKRACRDGPVFRAEEVILDG